jgi:hypothetical protein
MLINISSVFNAALGNDKLLSKDATDVPVAKI